MDNELHTESKGYAKKTGRTLSGLIQICLVNELKKEKKDVQQ